MNIVTKGLEPARVLSYFEEISAIPRGSGNEKGIADYLENFAKAHGLFCYRDELHNIMIKKPASAGHEAAEAVLLQGHTDIVCEKNNDCPHDFEKDPLKLYIEGDYLKAEGTTLGADNGTAVAYMLAILEDDALVHPALECLFTVQEETGMDGARGFDGSQISAKTMINLDAGPEGVATVSCAGGMRIDMKKQMRQIPFAGRALRLEIKGLMGGHSGTEINHNRANANVLMARVLYNLPKANIISLAGGSKDNAIPRECIAVVAVPDIAAAKEAAQKMQAQILAECAELDQGFCIQMEEVEAPPTMGDCACSKQVVSLMYLAPNGVLSMSPSMQGLVESSSNMGVVRTEGEDIWVSFSPRSSVESRQDQTEQRLKILAEAFGFEFHLRNRYPGWAYDPNSRIRELAKSTYEQMFQRPFRLEAIHAGLECGILKAKAPQMDIVAIGPDEHNGHTPDEEVSISSMNRVYQYVRALLEKLAQ